VKTVESLVDEFEESLPFQLDGFQREAIEKLDQGRGGVLVSAPTSSGKTIVAEYAIFRALKEGAKVIYTTPLKALSNQKYHDFLRAYGEATIGLVTGENTINDDAPVVVMTTEILRNLIYEDPERLERVSYVILDEVDSRCRYAPGAVRMKLSVIVIGQRGPAAKGDSVDLNYFVAVTGPGDAILAKKPLGVHIVFPPNKKRAGVTDRFDEVIPLEGRNGSDLNLVAGFQQSPEVVDFYHHFRGR